MRLVEDWALVPTAEMAALYRRESDRWRAELDWDTADTWAALERARRNGRVPGFVVRQPGGAVAGWTYYLLQGSELQIGALVASSAATAATLLDRVLGSPAATVASRALFFAYTPAPDVTRLLEARGFAVGAEHYLMRPLDAAGADAASLRVWRDTDLDAVAGVLGAAYGADPKRAFVPSGAPAEWRLYVQQLTLTTGCGRFLPAVSMVSPAADGLDGVALVTCVSETTAHLAQLAVHPGAGGGGLGSRLLEAVMAGATRSGYRRLSLLVNDRNTRAARLYARAGFVTSATFVSATRPRRRATTAALGEPAA